MFSRFALSRQGMIVLALFAVFATGVVLFSRSQSADPAYDPSSRGPQGLLLWREWLLEMGYAVQTTGRASFTLPPATALLFIYPGVENFTEDEADRLVDWVENGGTLVLVGVQDSQLLDRFDFEMVEPDMFSATAYARQSQPLLPDAPISWAGPGPVLLPTGGEPAVPIIVLPGGAPAVSVQAQNAGVVWLLPERYAFTNADLMENEQPYLLIAALRGVPAGALVVLDTYHLFGRSLLADNRIVTIQDWLYGTATGWATLFLIGLIVIFLFLNGRRLGPPLLIPTQGRRREAAEYVVAMAGLQRRANVSDSIARHHRRRLRRALGRPYRISADVDDAEFLRRLRQIDARIDDTQAQRIQHVLAGLAALPDSEKLVELVAEADEILSKRTLRRGV